MNERDREKKNERKKTKEGKKRSNYNNKPVAFTTQISHDWDLIIFIARSYNYYTRTENTIKTRDCLFNPIVKMFRGKDSCGLHFHPVPDLLFFFFSKSDAREGKAS